MILAVTAMVRDEIDLIDAWVGHHRAQGVDVIIVTDNASEDGTREALQAHADAGHLVLLHDPVHRKQQGTVVTQMARDAAVLHGADWVVNADADEFLVPVDRTLTLKDVFTRLDPAIRSFTVPVVNLIGPLAESGAGFERLVWRDDRSSEDLAAAGLLAHPTHNAVHVGSADVVVAQGNHIVTIESKGSPPPGLELEVLHLPWRSWRQVERKVAMAGAGYQANPDLNPSPNHHGMRDFLRLKEGTLLPYAAARHVDADAAVRSGLVEDTFLRDELYGLGLSSGTEESPLDGRLATVASDAGRALVSRDRAFERRDREAEAAEHELRRAVEALEVRLRQVEGELSAQKARRVVRLVDAVSERTRGGRKRSD
jgi:hypothetical protein